MTNSDTKDTLRSKLLKLNLGYDALVEQFLKNLIEFPGTYCRVPLPLHKGQTHDQWQDEKQEIINRTKEISAVMGLNCTEGQTEYSLMIDIPLDDF